MTPTRKTEDQESKLLNGILAMAGILLDAQIVLAALEEFAMGNYPEQVDGFKACLQHIADTAGILADISQEQSTSPEPFDPAWN